MTSRTFWSIAGIATVVKLWLTSFIAINVRLAPHDNGNFLEHAKFVLMGAWFGPYNDLTLIKGPGTELYLAAIRELGLPLPLAHQLLYLAACLAACGAVVPIVRRSGPLAALFCALLFDPFTFSANAWGLNRSQLTDSLALLCLAGAMGALLRARRSIAAPMPWLGLLGGAVATLSLTREDTVWIVPPLLVFGAFYLRVLFASRIDRRGLRVALALAPAVCVALAYAAIATINGAVYGWNTTVETTSPEFVSAYQSMSRIVVPGIDDNRTFPAPRAARAIAARVSPAAASLVPFFDPDGMWERTSCATLHLCGDVSAGWFLWAFRDSVQGAGSYTSGATARAFYVRIAREIDAACDAGRIVCRKKSYSLAPPVHVADLPVAARFAGEAFWHAVSFDQVALGEPAGMSAADESVRADYAGVVSSSGSRISTFRGWLVRPRSASLRLDGRYATDFLSVDFEPSPAVEKRFARTPEFATAETHRARFVISTSCVQNCVLLIGSGARATRVPLAASVTDYRAPGIAYHLDFSSSDPIPYASGGFKAAMLGFVLALYQTLGPIAFALAAVAFALRSVRVLRGKRRGAHARAMPLVAGTATAVAAHCGTLGIVSAVSFYALFPEYEAALYPLVLLGTALEIALEVPLLLRIFRRSVRTRRIARSVVAS